MGMNVNIIAEKFFPKSRLVEVHQDGSERPIKRGVLVCIGRRADGSMFGEIDGQYGFNLEFESDGKTLEGFDGGFFLPREICQLLNESGFIADESRFCA